MKDYNFVIMRTQQERDRYSREFWKQYVRAAAKFCAVVLIIWVAVQEWSVWGV